MVNELSYLIGLSKIKSIGSVRFFKLYEKYKSIEKVFHFNRADLQKLKFSEQGIDETLKYRDQLNIRQEMERVLSEQIKPISYFSDYYPETLKQIYAPPFLLYAKGNLELFKKTNWLAVVGTRFPTFYGLKTTSHFVQDLVANDWGIVSGLAKGIDAVAHETCLKKGGSTIAVLGCGIDIIYPTENRELYKQIEQNGLIISEMSLGTEPQPFQFPLRNRIITGLAKGTLVIEGDYKSGAMISAKLALEQNREVFALPGRIIDGKSNGPNWLIKQGAKLVINIEDILEEFYDRKISKKSVVQKFQNSKKTIPQLSPVESKVYKELSGIDSQNIENLCDKTRLPITELMMVLSGLELKGLVKQLPGKQYLLCD